MESALTLGRTTIGQKAIVAVTGLVLFGFVIGHLAGNLLLFAGPGPFNEYTTALKSIPPLLWGTRIVMLVSVVAHVTLTVKLARRNARARPIGYRKVRQDVLTTYAARTMVISGPLLALYIAFHLAHFTVPGLDFSGGAFSHTNLYANVVRGFRVWWVSAIYIFASFLLGLHLHHGVWSALQSLGAQHRQFDALRRRVAIGLAIIVAGGMISIPIAVQARLVGSADQIAESEAFAIEEE